MDANDVARARLTAGRWIELLAEWPPAAEGVILISRLKRPYGLLVPKRKLKTCFGGAPGVSLSVGDDISLSPSAKATPRVDLPEDVVARLQLSPRCYVCVSQRRADGVRTVRRLEMQEGESDVPGAVVLDSFSPQVVTRTRYSRTTFEALDPKAMKKLVAQMGTLKHDPWARLSQAGGRPGYLSRQRSGAASATADRALCSQCEADILAAQGADGSWDDSSVTTAFQLIRLAELGKTTGDAAVAKAVQWLLSCPEPAGSPGLFTATTPIAQEFDRLKPTGDAPRVLWEKVCHYFRPKAGLPRKYQPLRDSFDQGRDIAPMVCELGITSASAVVLHALLRLGLADHDRVKKAINTLLAAWRGYWCAHKFYVREWSAPTSTEGPDFNNRFAAPDAWYDETKCTEMTAPSFPCRQVGDNEVLMEEKIASGCGGCSPAIYEALSWHPGFAGSNLEVRAAMGYAEMQSASGHWWQPRAGIMHHLARFSHPLAAFLVARTVPQLIRDQAEDGLWAEGEAGSLDILTALDHFGFLDSLRPGQAADSGAR